MMCHPVFNLLNWLVQDWKDPSVHLVSTDAMEQVAATGRQAFLVRWGRGVQKGSTASWAHPASQGMAGSTPQVSRVKEGRTAIPGIGSVHHNVSGRIEKRAKQNAILYRGLPGFQHSSVAEKAQGVNQARMVHLVSRDGQALKEKGVKV